MSLTNSYDESTAVHHTMQCFQQIKSAYTISSQQYLIPGSCSLTLASMFPRLIIQLFQKLHDHMYDDFHLYKLAHQKMKGKV